MFRRSTRPKWQKIVNVVVLSAIVILFLATVGDAIRGGVDVGTFTGLTISSVALALDYTLFLRETAPAVLSPLAEEADKFATQLAEYFTAESRSRRVDEKNLLPVSWVEVEPDPADVGSTTAQRRRLQGRVEGASDTTAARLAESYQDVVNGRIVVLGEPGAGKSALALLLTLGLLRRRQPGGAVPVMISISSWDPTLQDLDSWIVSSLASRHFDNQEDVPRRLQRGRLLLPVLDGLDEIPEVNRRAAIGSINAALGPDSAVILTCRTAEYGDLILGGSPTLSRAPVVEVVPLSVSDVVAYLDNLVWPPGTDWAEAFTRLDAEPNGPVAAALSTPLMVSLVRSIFQRLGGSPRDLFDPQRFPSRHAVEEHLTTKVIDAAYAPSTTGPSDDREWNAAEARAWLAFVARYMYRYGERELIWWSMSSRLLSAWVAPMISLLLGIVVMGAVAFCKYVTNDKSSTSPVGGQNVLLTSVTLGAVCGVTFAALFMVVWNSGTGRPPVRLCWSRAGSLFRLRRGIEIGLAAGCSVILPVILCSAAILTLLDSWTVANEQVFVAATAAGVATVLLIAVVFAGNSWLTSPAGRFVRTSTVELIHQDRLSAFVASAIPATVAALAVLPVIVAGALAGNVTFFVASGWAGWPGSRDLPAAARMTVWNIEDVFGRSWVLASCFSVLIGSAVFLSFFLLHAWPRFVATRAALAVSRRLPWALTGFLTDARQRDLLRESAGGFQFRHARLQEALVNGRSPSVPSAGSTGTASRGRRAVPRKQLLVALGAAGAAITAAVGLLALPENGARATVPRPYGSEGDGVTISPDGKFVATRSDGRVDLWQLQTGEYERSFSVPRSASWTYEFSPDGRAVVLEVADDSDRSARSFTQFSVFDSYTGRPLVELADDVQFLAGGRTMMVSTGLHTAGNGDDVQSLWAIGSGAPLREYPTYFDTKSSGPSDGSDRGADSRSGPDRTLVKTRDGAVLLVDTTDGHTVATLSADGAEAAVDAALVGDQVEAKVDAGVRVWKATSGAFIGTFPVADPDDVRLLGPLNRVVFTSGGRQGIDADDDTLSIVDADSGAVLKTYHDELGFMTPQFLADGRFAIVGEVSGDGTWVIDTRSGELRSKIPDVRREGRPVVESGYSSEGDFPRFLTERAAGGTDLYDTSGKKVVELDDVDKYSTSRYRLGEALSGPNGPLGKAILFSSSMSVMATTIPLRGSPAEDITLLDTRSGRTLCRIPVDSSFVPNWSGFSPDGRVFLAAYVDGVHVWDVASAQPVAVLPNVTLPTSFGEKRSLSFSHDGTKVATVSVGAETVEVWDVQSGRNLNRLVGHSGPAEIVGFSADGNTLVTQGRADYTTRIWDVSRPDG